MKQVVAPSSSSEPGTLQYGVLHASSDVVFPAFDAPVVVRSDGSGLCVTCRGIAAFDATLHETGRVDIDGQDTRFVRQFMFQLAVAPDDAVYAVVPGGVRRIDDLGRVSTPSKPRWMAPTQVEAVTIVAGMEGPYVGLENDPDVSPPDLTIRGFDAVTGQSRTVAHGQLLLAAARGGGVFTVEPQGKRSATLHRLDPAGTVVWSRTLTPTSDGLTIDGGAATADGGFVVFGDTSSALDLGNSTSASPGPFVAGFDALGMALWVIRSESLVTNIAVTAQGEILIAGYTAPGGGDGTLPTDAFLSVATSAGITRTLLITGPGDQRITGLAATPDGFAWINIASLRHDDLDRDLVFQIGDHRFPEGNYLFKIVP